MERKRCPTTPIHQPCNLDCQFSQRVSNKNPSSAYIYQKVFIVRYVLIDFPHPTRKHLLGSVASPGTLSVCVASSFGGAGFLKLTTEFLSIGQTSGMENLSNFDSVTSISGIASLHVCRVFLALRKKAVSSFR